MSKQRTSKDTASAIIDAPMPILTDKDMAALEFGYGSSDFIHPHVACSGKLEYRQHFGSGLIDLLLRLAEVIPPNIYNDLRACLDRAEASWKEQSEGTELDDFFPLNRAEYLKLQRILRHTVPVGDPRRIWYEIGRNLCNLATSQYDLSSLVKAFQDFGFSDIDETKYEAAKAAFRARNPLPSGLFHTFSDFDFNGPAFVKGLARRLQNLPPAVVEAMPTLKKIKTMTFEELFAIHIKGHYVPDFGTTFPRCDYETNEIVVFKLYGSIQSQMHDIVFRAKSQRIQSHSANANDRSVIEAPEKGPGRPPEDPVAERRRKVARYIKDNTIDGKRPMREVIAVALGLSVDTVKNDIKENNKHNNEELTSPSTCPIRRFSHS